MPYSYDDEEEKLRAGLPLAAQKRVTTRGPEGNMRPELVSGFPDVVPPSLTQRPAPFGQPKFAASPQARPTPYGYGDQGKQTGFKITDPLTGRERGFATEEEAQGALQASTSRSPQALAAARNDIAQRNSQGFVAAGGQIPQGGEQVRGLGGNILGARPPAFNAQEQALVPELAQQSRLLAPQQQNQVRTSAQQPYGQQVASRPLAALPQQQGATILRGTNVSRAGPLDEGNDPFALARQQLAANIRAGSEQGADLNRYLPALQAVEGGESKLPTLSQAQGELLRTNPEKYTKTFPPAKQEGSYSFGDQLAPTYAGEGEAQTEIPGALPVIDKRTGKVKFENQPSAKGAPAEQKAPVDPNDPAGINNPADEASQLRNKEKRVQKFREIFTQLRTDQRNLGAKDQDIAEFVIENYLD